MKTIKLILLVSISILCVQCSDETELLQPEAKLKVANYNVTLNNDKTFEIIDIIDSEGRCYVESYDNEVVQAQLTDKSLILIAVKNGQTKVKVLDDAGKKAEINVSIDEFTQPEVKKEAIYIKKGDTRTLYHPYTKVAGYTLIKGQNSELINEKVIYPDSLAISGLILGQTKLSVCKEYRNVCHYYIAVVENYPLEISTKKYSVFAKPTHFGGPINIGNGSYNIESSDPSIAVGTIEAYAEGWEKTNYNFNEASIKIETLGKPGTTILTVIDAAGLTETIEVEVRDNKN